MVTFANKKLLPLLLVLALFVLCFPFKSALAIRPDSFKDLLSDSRPSVAANHTITLDMSSTTNFVAGETLIIDFDNSVDTSGFANNEPEDFDITVNGAEQTIVANAGCSTSDAIEITTVNTSTDTFTFTACGSYVSTGDTGTAIVIEIGTNATAGSAGNDQITNPTAGTYIVNFAGTYGDDTQDAIIVITAATTVAATIDESLTATVAGVTSANCDITGGTDVSPDPTATTIGFNSITPETFYNACQSITVGTNAAGGYAVTVYTTTGLDAGANAFNVGSCDAGGCTLVTPNTWATATNNGYAVCMKDETGDAAATANAGWDTAAELCGGASQKFELVADLSGAQTPSTIMRSATPISGDVSEVGWRISADSTQAAGAYTGTADYITTGTF